MDTESGRRTRAAKLVMAYPFVLILVGVAINLFLFGVRPLVVALPPPESVVALTISAVLLVGNHTWLMTTTELTRVRFNMVATPEEWAERNAGPQDVPRQALDALERRHNAHRNTTENAVYFVFLASILAIVSPATLAVQVWAVGFGVARLGYTYSYLAAKTDARGLFMSLSLLALYGMASYLVMAALA